MLTRIEIDGFKTFEKFDINVGPFLVILGPNASGKSNLFDGIRLLSNLAGTDLRTAVKGLRGEPHELFRRNAAGEPGNRMTFAVEVLLDPMIRDPWGATIQIKHSRIRYEVVIERRKGEQGIERLVVAEERALPILRQVDKWRPGGRAPSTAFSDRFLHYGRKAPWLETERNESKASFDIHQDGHAGRTRSAEAAEATVLSSITSAEYPHLFALREELRSWRFLQLDPVAMRRPSPTTAPEFVEPDGSNLATVLARIQSETRTEERPHGIIPDIAADLAALIPGVIRLNVVEDTQNREYRIDITLRDGPPFTSRVVSDGTLRVLALLTLLHDPRHRGLVCFEEPENGIHPLRLKNVICRLRELLTDPTREDIDSDESLSQMMLNSHSPVVLSSLGDGEAMFADVVAVADPETRSLNRKTRMRPVLNQDQREMFADGSGEPVPSYQVHDYLSTVGALEGV